jgi:hypothetical protein
MTANTVDAPATAQRLKTAYLSAAIYFASAP